MSKISNNQAPEAPLSIEQKIRKLEHSVAGLLKYCQQLSEENRQIKQSNNQLMIERSELQTKNDKVRGQVEAMIERLRAMDKAS